MINFIKEIFTLAFVFPLIVLVGGYLSIRLNFLQIFGIKKAFRLLTTKSGSDSISSFSALSAILGGNLGTGNISGIAVALSTGGPGSLFWMWVMAILASVTKYAGCYLGVHYQRQNEEGEWVGGPMYYLRYGLNSKTLAALFCVFTISSALTVGNFVQVHSLLVPLRKFPISPLFFGVPIALLLALVILGGMKRFANVVSVLVPFMAIVYLGTCLIVLGIFYDQIIPSLVLIVESAFNLKPAIGGVMGFSIMKALGVGFDRGLFATDCGLGLAPIVHSSVKSYDKNVDNRVAQGLISILSPMIVMVVCTLTGLVLLTTKAYLDTSLVSTDMCIRAFKIAFNQNIAENVITITLFFFAFTTILTWSFCSDRAVGYLLGTRAVKPFQIFFILMVPFGAFIHDDLIWPIADMSINFMFTINMIGIIGLFRLVLGKKSQSF